MSMTMVKLVTIDCDIGDHLKTSLPCCSMIVLAQRREDRNGKLRWIKDGGGNHNLGGGDHNDGGGDHNLGGGDHNLGDGDHNFCGGDHNFGGGDHNLGGGDEEENAVSL